MAEALGMLFRYCINSPGELATLAQELDNVHHYLLIQRYRYGDRFTYEEHIENEDVMDSSLPVMTLQPLVENALYHGIKKKRGGGTILIEGKLEGNKILLKVIDNGKGMTEQELARLRRYIAGCEDGGKQGFGLGNVNQRIHRYYGEEYGIFFESEENRGTEAVIIIPAKIIEQKS